MGVEVYVGQLSGEVTEDEVRKLFSVVGTVESLHLVKDSETGSFRGCGYVRMSTEDEARESVNMLNGAMLGGRLIAVKMSIKQNERKGSYGDVNAGGSDGRHYRGKKQ
jgi:RNA recognition motif-containing protein